jgi:hypothetical protein
VRVIAYRPSPSGGGYADIEAAPGIKLRDVKIIRAHDGNIRAYARNTSFDRNAVAEIQKSLDGGICLESRIAS